MVPSLPDIAADGALLPFRDQSTEIVVLHHVLEHFGCGEAAGLLRESYRVLCQGGRLFIFVPDLRALAKGWLNEEIDDYTFIVNLCGAYMGLEEDRHKWHHTRASLPISLNECGAWRRISEFDWRPIDGADIAQAWWILGIEAVK